MSGFGAWAAGAGGTGVLLLCLFTLGLILGYLTGWRGRERAARADAREDRAEKEAAEYVAELRPLPSDRPTERTRVRIDYRPEKIPGLGTPIWARQQEEWEPAHVGAALALTRPETDEEFSARLAGVADEIIAWAHRAGEQWSGQ